MIPKEELSASDRSFYESVTTRRSIRDFGEDPLSLAGLFKNLNQSYGIAGQIPIPGDSVDKTMLCVAFLGKPK